MYLILYVLPYFFSSHNMMNSQVILPWLHPLGGVVTAPAHHRYPSVFTYFEMWNVYGIMSQFFCQALKTEF